MTETRPVVLIGLDAFDPGLARRFATSGDLPTLGRLLESGTRCTVSNPFGLFVGALWANFGTALRPARHRFHCWNEIEIETYRHRLNTPRLEAVPKFWDLIEEAGFEVAAIDVPHMRVGGQRRGVRLFEWGCHDRHFGLQSWPPDLAGRLEAHPILGMDCEAARDFAADDFTHRASLYRTLEEERLLLDGLKRGAAMKGRLLASLLGELDWDLFIGVFGESHAVGHQQWHLHDETHSRFDPAIRDSLGGDPMLQVYRQIDEALGQTLAAAPADALFMVLLSHGMGPHYDGIHLLDEILTRLDRAYGGKAAVAAEPVRAVLPALRAFADRLGLAGPLRSRLGRLADRGGAAPARARQRFFMEPNNYVFGGIRLNLIGREPRGCVDPAEADALCEQLTSDLLDLVNLATGRPVVTAVERTDVHHRRSPDDMMPDLLVEWDRSSLIETVASPKIGRLHCPYTGWRSGDHLQDGLLLVCGPGIPAGEERPAIAVEDIGPSLAEHFGVALDDVDGETIPWIASAMEMAR